jgi:hypothetical protein
MNIACNIITLAASATASLCATTRCMPALIEALSESTSSRSSPGSGTAEAAGRGHSLQGIIRKAEQEPPHPPILVGWVAAAKLASGSASSSASS